MLFVRGWCQWVVTPALCLGSPHSRLMGIERASIMAWGLRQDKEELRKAPQIITSYTLSTHSSKKESSLRGAWVAQLSI